MQEPPPTKDDQRISPPLFAHPSYDPGAHPMSQAFTEDLFSGQTLAQPH
jgi:hypothetical protein